MSWKTVKYKGIEYRSLFALCKHLKKNYQKTLERIARGYPIEAAIEVDDLRSCPVRDYKGKLYKSVKEFRDAYEFKNSGYLTLLLKNKTYEQISKERLENPTFIAKKIAREMGLKGIKELLAYLQLPKSTYNDRVKRGMTVKQALGLEN